MSDADLPEAAWWTAIAALSDVGPIRLAALQDRWCGAEAWARLAAGSAVRDPALAAALGSRAAVLGPTWQAAVRVTSVEEVWQRHLDAGVLVSLPDSATMPEALAADPYPPRILFSVGDLARLDGPRVGIVGTRQASRYGRDVARELGHDLAQEGIRVVSGLALGIDGAAHAGALAAASAEAAPPIGVVGSGLDRCYPAPHRDLWAQVAERGVLLSEAPLGASPTRWRFPARNRLIAALSDLLVVVESPLEGGALLTAVEAAERGREVYAVPGSVRARSSAGANDLLADGAGVCRDAEDVRVGLGLIPGGRRSGPAGRRRRLEHRPLPEPVEQQVLDAIGWQPTSLEQVAVRTSLPLTDLSAALTRLEAAGWVAEDGGWYEQVTLRSTR